MSSEFFFSKDYCSIKTLVFHMNFMIYFSIFILMIFIVATVVVYMCDMYVSADT